MSSSHSDSSTETYTISGSSSTYESDEEMNDKPRRKSTQVEQQEKQFKFISMKAIDGNESNSTDSSHENEITIPEIATITEGNLPQISANRTIELNEAADMLSMQSQNHSKSSNQTESDSASKITSEFLSCEIPFEQALFKPFFHEISSKASDETTSDSSSCAIVSSDTLTQSSSVQVFSTEPTHTPSQNIEPEPLAATTQITAKSATFQEEVVDTSPSLIEDTNALVSENNTQNGPTKANASSTINAEFTNEAQLLQQIQTQQSLPISVSSSKMQMSSTVPAQTSLETSEAQVTQTCAAVPQLLDNLPLTPSTNFAMLNFEVVSRGTGAGAPEVPKFVESDVMEKNNSGDGIVSKEQQQSSGTVGVKSMTGNEVESIEVEVGSNAVLEERQNSLGGTSHKVDESKPIATQFETPRRPAPSIDSRTITRPSKVRAQQLPEAAVTPFPKTESGSTTADMLAANTGQPLPSPAATRSRDSSQPPQILGQQSAIASQPQIIQQALPPKSVQQRVAASKLVLQQTSAPKITPQLEQQQQPTATAALMRGVTQPVVVPPNITPSLPVVDTNSTVVSNAAVAAQGPPNPENSQREERKSLQRVRQRTVTVQSQLSLDITAAYNQVKQMNSDDPATELVRRVQAIVATREKEWTAKNEKLSQLLAHEQRRNEPLEQKAAERLLAMAEYEKLMQEFVEELKKKNGDGELKSVGRPGPERNLSPDDVTQLLKERDQLAEEVNSLETSYSELFRRYEKLRQTSVEIKRNEDNVKSASEEMARRYSLLVEKFEMLRRNAEEQLDLANNEIERLIKQHEADTLGLRLKVKHQESKIDSLTMSLEARQKELENMTAIFEEVITKAEANDAADEA
ncbi:unnamed protein product [Cercopithifilaria johnstoni]|uniref:Transforming acidic coiled-coil-containing protein C-terminal domain-containing protein n=1 Tax=Cercopithifilaria johnstoni TaxID=2874296 RepID=A0A8J2Q8J1_9BILA|nr:unnamed protein product [Cercopithifilaria johnstoni]